MLAAALGTEMMAALGVVTGFFGGLALGALVLDAPIRRTSRLRLVYAGLELSMAAWALVSIWLLPASGRMLAVTLGPTPPAALLWVAGFALPALVLLPATAAMGGTLIALERLVAGSRRDGRVTAGVYGANTAGAAAGCLLSVFLLMPSFGMSGTLSALAAVNLLCALGSLALGPCVDVVPPVRRSPDRQGGARLLMTLAAAGLLGIALEVLVIRLAAQVLQNTIYSFACLLAAYLVGTALGGLAWQRAQGEPSQAAISALLAAACVASVLTATMVRLLGPLALDAGATGLAWEFAVAGALFLLPSAAMGALFGCLAQSVRDRNGSLGVAIGVNGLGAAMAPPLVTLVLIPAVGPSAALLLVAIAYLLLMPPVNRRLPIACGAAALAAIVLLWRPTPLVRVPPGGALLESRDGPTATASAVTDASGARYLEVNGHFRMGGTSSQRSDWRQAQIPLLLHPDPHRALFLGVGTGATLQGAASLPGIAAFGVELAPEVVALLPRFTDPTAPKLPPIVTADARRFVLSETARFDVIVADLFHPALDGTGALYTVEHFAGVRERLAGAGLFCQWLPLYQLDPASLNAIVRSFLAVFPDGSAWLAHFGLQTPMLALIGSRDAPRLDPAALQRRLSAPAMQPALRRTGLLAPLDLLGLYVGGPETLASLAGPGPRNLDDAPFVAFEATRNVRALSAPPSDLLLAVLRSADPAAPPPGAEPLGDRIAAYRRARDRFIAVGAALPPGLDERALMNAAIPGLLDTLRLDPGFDPAYTPLLSMAMSLLGQDADDADRKAAIRILQAIEDVAPERPEAGRLLARLSAQ